LKTETQHKYTSNVDRGESIECVYYVTYNTKLYSAIHRVCVSKRRQLTLTLAYSCQQQTSHRNKNFVLIYRLIYNITEYFFKSSLISAAMTALW